MFSTVLNILSWTLWTIKNIFLLFLLVCRLSWKLLLFLVFLDRFYKAIKALHEVCKLIAEKSSHEKKKSDLNVLLHQSSEDISVVSEMSSFNTNEEYVVESWNSYQVKLWSKELANHGDDFQNISEEDEDDGEDGYIAAYKTG